LKFLCGGCGGGGLKINEPIKNNEKRNKTPIITSFFCFNKNGMK
jgi:hypothetical protein